MPSRVNPLGSTHESPENLSTPRKKYDWGDSSDISVFFGREDELNFFYQWAVSEKYRVLGLWGMGGMGKTTFTIKVCKGQNDINDDKCIRNDFEYVIFRSLRETLPLSNVLTDAILLFSDNSENVPVHDDDLMNTLLTLMSEKRCLIVLDNMDSITENDEFGSVKFKSGFDNYKTLIGRIGSTTHKSCLLINGREKTDDFTLLENANPNRVKSHDLKPIDVEAGKKIFTLKGEHFTATDKEWVQIVNQYNGNPLQLSLIKTHIIEMFSYNLTDFLSCGTLLINNINDLIGWHFNRLSTRERDILLWMAIHMEAVSIEMLEKDLSFDLDSQSTIRNTMQTLIDKIPLEKSNGRYSMQPVLLEYVTRYLMKIIVDDIKNTTFQNIGKYSLLLTSSFVHIQEMQSASLLDYVNKSCLTHFLSQDRYETALKELIKVIRAKYTSVCYYAIGNIINLLCRVKNFIENWDFSNFTIVNVNLQETYFFGVNFGQSKFVDCIFRSTFGPISSLAISHDGKYIAANESFGDIHIWDLTSLQLINTLRGHINWVFALSFSQDDSYIVSGGEDKKVYMWSNWKEESYKLKIIDKTHTNSIWAVAISNNGRYIATGGEDKSIHIYDINSGNTIKSISNAHDGKVFSVCFNSDSTLLASTGADCAIKLWNIKNSFQYYYELTGHEKTVKSAVFSADDSVIVSCSWDNTIRFWNLDSKTEIADKRISINETILSLVLDPKTSHLACSLENGIIQVWNYETNTCIKNITGHKGEVWKIAFTDDAQLLVSGGYDRTLRVWNTNDWSCGNILHGYINWIQDFSLSKEGNTIVCTNGDLSLDIWDVITHNLDVISDAHNGWTFSVEHCLESRILVTGSDDKKIRIWDPKDWYKPPIVLRQVHDGWVQKIAFSCNGKLLASGSDDKTVVVWDMNTREVKHILKGHAAGVWALSFSPDNWTLASGDESGNIILWNAITGRRIKNLHKLKDRIHAVVFGTDGKFLYSASEDAKIKKWNIIDKSSVELYNHNGWAMALAISQDGKKLVSGGKDGKVIVYDLKKSDIDFTIDHKCGVWAVAFSRDGNTIISAGEDGNTIFWNITEKLPYQEKIFCKKKPYEDTIFSSSDGLSHPQISSLITLGGKLE
jgi:WD40 repeat protein